MSAACRSRGALPARRKPGAEYRARDSRLRAENRKSLPRDSDGLYDHEILPALAGCCGGNDLSAANRNSRSGFEELDIRGKIEGRHNEGDDPIAGIDCRRSRYE
jgi:hypothetical protein